MLTKAAFFDLLKSTISPKIETFEEDYGAGYIVLRSNQAIFKRKYGGGFQNHCIISLYHNKKHKLPKDATLSEVNSLWNRMYKDADIYDRWIIEYEKKKIKGKYNQN